MKPYIFVYTFMRIINKTILSSKESGKGNSRLNSINKSVEKYTTSKYTFGCTKTADRKDI